MDHNTSHPSPHFRHTSSDPMGNEGLFLSHAVLGTFMIGLGFWWWIQSLRRCLTFIRRSSTRYTSSASYGSGCCPHQTAEGAVKIVISVLGIVVEAVTVSKGRQIQYAHYPFYAAMIVAGSVDVLMSTIIFLPDGLDYLAQTMPLVLNAYTLRAQTYDQPILTDASHMLSSYVYILATFAMLGEMCLPNHFVFSWIKCMMIMLVGAWQWQTGIVLNAPFPTSWKEGGHNSVMDLAIICCWQLSCIALLQLVTLVIAAKCYGVSPNWIVASRYSTGEDERNPNDGIQYTKLLNSESGEDSYAT
ncbi:unnamed protein product [Calicophoron daubneyi]|uniref:Transmembrane protein 45B n=1 Tax=Calicophoron daubneyi TaxID=300641 RepID=A0AAV2TFF0_CALDB